MPITYKPLDERTVDYQYHRRLMQVLDEGELLGKTPQGVGAWTCFGTLPQMVFPLENGVPLITERSNVAWRSAIAEIIAFINGARTIDEIESYGVIPAFWGKYRGKGTKRGLDPDDMGPGSYGAVFHDYERADGTKLNQFALVLEQIRKYPEMRTHKVTNWRPDYIARGPARKVIVAPCHGDLHFRVIEGRLDMVMVQRSGDLPIGVPHNLIQYGALLLMMAQVTGYQAGTYIHVLSDGHIYENQVEAARAMTNCAPRPFPTLHLDESVTDLFAFRKEHFTLREHNPHPRMEVPFAP